MKFLLKLTKRQSVMTKILKILTIFLLLYLNVSSRCIAATSDIAMVLLLDQSSALSEDEFTLEKQAFVEALNGLPNTSNGRVQIASIVNTASPNIISDLSRINSNTDLEKFQTVLADTNRNISRNNINAALSTAIDLLINSSSHRKIICLANHTFVDDSTRLQTLTSYAKKVEIVIVPIGLNANTLSAAQLEGMTSQLPISNIQHFSELKTAIEKDCIAKVQYMLMTAVLTPLANGIEPFSRTFTLGTQVDGNTVTDASRYSVTTFDATSALGGTVVDNGNLTFSYTLPTLFLQQDSFNYTVNDNIAGTNNSSMWMISPLVANADSATVKSEAIITLSVLDNDANFSGDTISINTFDATSTQGGTITNDGNNGLVYTSALGFIGTDTFTYSVATSAGFSPSNGSAIATITVTAPNTAPIANNDTANTTQNTAVTTPNVLSNDSDADGDTLSITSADATSTEGGTISNNNDGTFLYTPPTGFTGSDSFNYIVNDGQDTATASVSITVNIGNTAPIANNDTANTTQDIAVTTPNVLSNDSDADGDTLSITSADATSTEGGIITNNNDGTFLYTPPTGFTGSDSFNYIMNDGQDTATASVSITVSVGNTAPIANNDTASISKNTSINIAVLDNDSDADNDTLSIKSVDTHSAHNGTIVKNSDNTIRYTPALNFVGSDTFTYSIEDRQGETDTASVTIIISPPIEMEQGSTGNIDVLANETNASVSLSQTESTQGGTLSVDASTNLIRYIPAVGFSGVDTFTYTVTDQNGNTRQGTISIVVNAAPTANNDTATTNQDTAITLTILANDTDIENDLFFISQLNSSSIQKGSIVKNADNSVTYTPASGFIGTDSFSYSIQDSKGGTDSATVSIKVNSLPTANEDSSDINQGETVRINVLANDSDLEGSLLFVSLTTTESSQGGTIRVDEGENNIILYTPADGFSGVDTFNYTVMDDSGGSTQGTVNIAVNAAPIAIDDSASANKDTAQEINVLINDSDADNDVLQISLKTQQSNKGGHIRIKDSTNGIIIYTPPLGFYSDNDTFEYTVTDSKGSSDTAIVVVVVVSLVANNDAVSTTEGTAVIINNVMENDIDSTNSIAILSFDPPKKGQLIHNGAGNFSYTPKANFIGFDSFRYTVQTHSGTSATATVNITINGAGGVSISEGGAMGINSLLMLFFLYFIHLLRQYWKFKRLN
jgi:hypothetical protein